MNPELVTFEVAGGVGHVTLDRPEALNALDVPTIRRLREILGSLESSNEVRAVLLTGTGRAFCAGGDVKAMLSMAGSLGVGADEAQAAMLEGVGELHPVLAGVHHLPKPVVCAVNGPAAGAGVGLALVGDVTWAARSATFTLAFTGIGVSPDSGTTFTLPRAVGPKLAAELFLTNRQLDAEEALAAGVVSRVLPDETLLAEARALAERLARGPTLAFGRVKELLRESLSNDFESQLDRERHEVGRSALTRDFGEGLAAFVEKRRPTFKGT